MSAATEIDQAEVRFRDAWPRALVSFSPYTRLAPPILCRTPEDEKREGLQGSFAMIRMTDERIVIGLSQIVELALSERASPAARAMHRNLQAARLAFVDVVDFVLANTRTQPTRVYAGSVPYLMLAGKLLAGWQLARALLIAEDQLAEGGGDEPFLRAKIATARFFAEHVLSTVPGMRDAIIGGADSVNGLSVDSF